MFSIIINVPNAILKSFDSFIHVGGTLDMTVHELIKNGAIRELYKATGGTFGGENVNRQFRILLKQIFTKSFLDNYACHDPVDWLCLMNDFEVKKR